MKRARVKMAAVATVVATAVATVVAAAAMAVVTGAATAGNSQPAASINQTCKRRTLFNVRRFCFRRLVFAARSVCPLGPQHKHAPPQVAASKFEVHLLV